MVTILPEANASVLSAAAEAQSARAEILQPIAAETGGAAAVIAASAAAAIRINALLAMLTPLLRRP